MDPEKVSDADDEAEMDATRWKIDVDQENPEIDVVEVIAELEETNPESLPSLYETIDELIDKLFSDPPPAEAQAMIQFTYNKYRIDVQQAGVATFMKIPEKK